VCRTCFKTVDLPSPLMEGASSFFNSFLFFSSLSPYRRGGGEGWWRDGERDGESERERNRGPFMPAPVTHTHRRTHTHKHTRSVSLRVHQDSTGLGHNDTRARALCLSLSGPFLPAPARGTITPAQMFFLFYFCIFTGPFMPAPAWGTMTPAQKMAVLMKQAEGISERVGDLSGPHHALRLQPACVCC